MIAQRTKVQLIVFAVITLLGVSYVGARYANLDKLFYADNCNLVYGDAQKVMVAMIQAVKSLEGGH